MPESYIETTLVWPPAALISIQLPDHPHVIITVWAPVSVADDIKLLLCGSHSAKPSLCRALSACACRYICTDLFSVSFELMLLLFLFGLGGRVHGPTAMAKECV